MRQDNSIQLFDEFFKTYTSVLRKNNVYDTLHIEKTYCQQIVSFRNINNIIDNGLLTGIAVSLSYIILTLPLTSNTLSPNSLPYPLTLFPIP